MALVHARTLAVVPLLAVGLGCAAAPTPVTTLEPQRDSISETEILREMQSHHARAVLGVGFSLLGGAVGLVLGGKIGYEIDYHHDIRQGCEDCGLGGMLLGGAIGGLTGVVAGATIGVKVGTNADRAAAIRRIKARRASRSG